MNGLLGNGLTGVDLTRFWISWRVIPLSRRSQLMYEYDCSDQTSNSLISVLRCHPWISNADTTQYSKDL